MVNALGKWDCVDPHGAMVSAFILLSFRVSEKSKLFILRPRATFLKLVIHFFFFLLYLWQLLLVYETHFEKH